MVFSVSECNEFIATYLQSIGEIVVEGEVSELRISQGKWLFLTLKDATASVSVFGIVYQLSNIKQLEEGMQVQVFGTPGVHQKSGRFSITARAIQPTGEGALKQAYEKLKVALTSEGLFADERKRPLSRFPQNIGLITAKGSQAFNDFIKVIGERMGGLTITYFPSSVQGNQAVGELIAAIRFANQHYSHLDALVITRGGGSLEDLIAFNDERVVRAIFASSIPVLSAVGHEGDISLCDLVADVRASTPSNAAELLVRDREEVLQHVTYMQSVLTQAALGNIVRAQRSVAYAKEQLTTHMRIRTQHITMVLRNFDGIQFVLDKQVRRAMQTIANMQYALRTSMLSTVRHQQHALHDIKNGMRQTVITNHKQSIQKVVAAKRLLEALDYRNVLKRGFSLTYTDAGTVVRSVNDAPTGATVRTILIDGELVSTVN